MSKRKQNFIDSAVQGQLVRRIMLHWVAFFAVLMMCVVFMQMLLGDPEMTLTDRIMAPIRQYMLIGLIMLSLLPAFMLDTVRFSNRFVGPIARLRRGLRELGEGKDIQALKFRDNDFWAEAANEFNVIANRQKELEQEIASLRNSAKKETV